MRGQRLPTGGKSLVHGFCPVADHDHDLLWVQCGRAPGNMPQQRIAGDRVQHFRQA
jgi:hypothetical protein